MYTSAEKKRTSPDGGKSSDPREARGRGGSEEEPSGDEPEPGGGDVPELSDGEPGNEEDEEDDEEEVASLLREPRVVPSSSSANPPLRLSPSPMPAWSSPSCFFPPRPKGNHLLACTRAGPTRDEMGPRENSGRRGSEDARARPETPPDDKTPRATSGGKPERRDGRWGGRGGGGR